jgi:thymidylate synthase (FAD)
MKIIKPSFEIIGDVDGMKILKKLERIGRTCYKSEDKITDESAKRFIETIIKNGHEAVIEHEIISVNIICDRGVSHELVRHRIASYAQESTRYCNYSKDKFGNELTFIEPCFWKIDGDTLEQITLYKDWVTAMQLTEFTYLKMLQHGAKPEQARSVLPNSLKTEIVMTMNLREWRHFFKLRTSSKAHPQMREIAVPLLQAFQFNIPIIFDDIQVTE